MFLFYCLLFVSILIVIGAIKGLMITGYICDHINDDLKYGLPLENSPHKFHFKMPPKPLMPEKPKLKIRPKP
jgi:hypothetical protein